eukprot:TRINITY_DN24653_c0_g1_i4.p2 TRINITY_DN24653_c0_g1~~TRINITY_DN24653_c0_g1_i4.p2  ORF type:complete len:152 (-),score=40.33 TRINITY_DN24653_c0_g1_i4:57-512(-)
MRLLFFEICSGFMLLAFFFFNDTATTEIYTRSIVGSVRCVQETDIQVLLDMHLGLEVVRNLPETPENNQLVCDVLVRSVDINRPEELQKIKEIAQCQKQICDTIMRVIGMQYLSLIHISEPTRPLYISYAVFCLKKKKNAHKKFKTSIRYC